MVSNAIETQGFKLEIGDVGDSPDAMVEIKEVTDFDGFDGQASKIETTHLQSTAKSYMMGLQDNGNFNISLNYLPTDPGQMEARAAKAARTKKRFVATFSDDSTATWNGEVLSAPVSGGVDAKVSGSMTISIDGDVTYA